MSVSSDDRDVSGNMSSSDVLGSSNNMSVSNMSNMSVSDMSGSSSTSSDVSSDDSLSEDSGSDSSDILRSEDSSGLVVSSDADLNLLLVQGSLLLSVDSSVSDDSSVASSDVSSSTLDDSVSQDLESNGLSLSCSGSLLD